MDSLTFVPFQISDITSTFCPVADSTAIPAYVRHEEDASRTAVAVLDIRAKKNPPKTQMH